MSQPQNRHVGSIFCCKSLMTSPAPQPTSQMVCGRRRFRSIIFRICSTLNGDSPTCQIGFFLRYSPSTLIFPPRTLPETFSLIHLAQPGGRTDRSLSRVPLDGHRCHLDGGHGPRGALLRPVRDRDDVDRGAPVWLARFPTALDRSLSACRRTRPTNSSGR